MLPPTEKSGEIIQPCLPKLKPTGGATDFKQPDWARCLWTRLSLSAGDCAQRSPIGKHVPIQQPNPSPPQHLSCLSTGSQGPEDPVLGVRVLESFSFGASKEFHCLSFCRYTIPAWLQFASAGENAMCSKVCCFSLWKTTWKTSELQQSFSQPLSIRLPSMC